MVIMRWYTKTADRSPSRNKFDFKGHLQETPKPISDQNLFSRFQTCWNVVQKLAPQKRSSHSGDISYVKESGYRKKQTAKLLEITESVYCFYECKNLVLTYCGFNNWNHFWHAHVCLTTPIWMDLIKWYIYVCLTTCKKSTLGPRSLLRYG